jgi:hypothetical protein
MSPADAFAARRKVMGEIEKESLDKTGLRSDVVTLYSGAAYHLYRYQKYTDVRLVFAPEHAVAFFGGDRDNFEYPRYNLDVCFFRAYEGCKPVRPKHFFRWNPDGPAEGDLVFVTGHPGTTQRLETSDKLVHRRDSTLPFALDRLRAMEAALVAYGKRGPEEARQMATDLHRVANARKAFNGQYEGLKNPAVLERKRADEAEVAAAKGVPPAVAEQYAQARKRIAEVQRVWGTFEREYGLYERGDAFPSELFAIARHLIRMREELKKPNAERLREYRESNLESLKFQLFSPAPVYRELERVKLEEGLRFLVKTLGEKHELVALALDGKTPAKRAEELVAGTKLVDSAARRAFYDGSPANAADSDDPMIRFALRVDPAARQLRQRFENEVEEPERQAYPAIAAMRFALFGRNVAPDATFTLRLAFGVVKGYEVDGQRLPFHTTFGGMFTESAKEGGKGDFALPERWLKGKDRLDLKTPFDFVSTADTIGGNSGSPVLNRAGELVGINFDRNRHGLVRNFVYTDVQARHIAVHSKGVLEALRKLYDCPALVKELTGGE